jgi:hypothetical protein
MKIKFLLVALWFTGFATLSLSQSTYNSYTSEHRTSNPFHTIVIKGEMNVKIIPSDTHEIYVSGTVFQVQNVITRVHNDTLLIHQSNLRDLDGAVRLTIHMNRLEGLDVSGLTKVNCTELTDTDKLRIRLLDGAKIKLPKVEKS